MRRVSSGSHPVITHPVITHPVNFPPSHLQVPAASVVPSLLARAGLQPLAGFRFSVALSVSGVNLSHRARSFWSAEFLVKATPSLAARRSRDLPAADVPPNSIVTVVNNVRPNDFAM